MQISHSLCLYKIPIQSGWYKILSQSHIIKILTQAVTSTLSFLNLIKLKGVNNLYNVYKKCFVLQNLCLTLIFKYINSHKQPIVAQKSFSQLNCFLVVEKCLTNWYRLLWMFPRNFATVLSIVLQSFNIKAKTLCLMSNKALSPHFFSCEHISFHGSFVQDEQLSCILVTSVNFLRVLKKLTSAFNYSPNTTFPFLSLCIFLCFCCFFTSPSQVSSEAF